MTRTMADHSRAYRQRRADRFARYHDALSAIAGGAEDAEGIAKKVLGEQKN